METLAADLTLPLGGRVCGVKQEFVLDGDGALVGGLQEVQAAQKGGLTAAGGADDGQDLALLQGKADVLQDPDGTKMLFNMLCF